MDTTKSDHSLSATAYWMASVRARESEREDCLIRDPWAADLAGETGMTWIAARSADSVLPIVIRTRYLPQEAITQLLDAVTGLAAPGSWLGFDIMNSVTLTSPLAQKWVEMQAQSGAPWIGTMDDPVTFLAQRGWQAALTQAGAADAHHGRWSFPVIPVTMPKRPHNWFVTARFNLA